LKVITSLVALRQELAVIRQQGHRIALVPTMGNLHRGHLRLVEEARRFGDRVVATIFVNPTQFAPGEDFDCYPRTPEADIRALEMAGADILFMPQILEMYPGSLKAMTTVHVPGLSEELCGAFRPGHFQGVATIVLKLFNMVAPQSAVFGEKDFQQLEIIRRMVHDLNLPIALHGVSTVRESSGLAMSSRNAYLSEEERQTAALIYQTLQTLAKALRSFGVAQIEMLEKNAATELTLAGFSVDYVSVRCVADLSLPQGNELPSSLVILAAARLGRTRLIDNLKVADAS
jgi:pantoate--beta-alanine ligase